MKNRILLILVLLFPLLSLTQNSPHIPLSSLEGKWYVNQSNFPMWLKGDKTNPTFNYSVYENKGDTLILDEVRFLKKGKTKSIVGIDRRVPESNNSFVWRGKGLLKIAKSKWEILWINSEQNILIIHFEKTIFTPEGYDVISRFKSLKERDIQEIESAFTHLGITGKMTNILQQ